MTSTERKRPRRRWVTAAAVVGALALVGTACGDDDSDSGSTDDTTETTEAAQSETTDLDVTAVDYEFEGIPDEIPAGTAEVTFTNDGADDHVLVVFRFNDDATLDEILQLSEAEAEERVTIVGEVFAPTGASETGTIELDEPGRYAAICPIPVGAHGDTEGTGPPHFVEGMAQEFEVT